MPLASWQFDLDAIVKSPFAKKAVVALLSFGSTLALPIIVCRDYTSVLTGTIPNDCTFDSFSITMLPLNNGIISLVICLGFFYVISKAISLSSWRSFFKTIPVGLVSSFVLAMGARYMETGIMPWDSIAFYCFVLLFSPIMTALFTLVAHASEEAGNLPKTIPGFKRLIANTTIRQRYCLAWLLLIICWIPCFLVLFPGITSRDYPYQVTWFLDGTISTHHPVLHTLFLGICSSLGIEMDTPSAGLIFYLAIQLLILSCCILYVMRRMRPFLPGPIWLLLWLYFALMPYHPLMAFCTNKDALFSGFFAVLLCELFLAKQNPSRFYQPKNLAFFGLIAFLVCAFRNTGVYIVAGTLLVLIATSKTYRAKAACTSLALFLCWACFIGPIYSLLGVQKSSAGEALSIPCIQLDRAMQSDGALLSESQRAEVLLWCPQAGSSSNMRIADDAKRGFDSDRFEKNPIEFLKLYFAVGLQNPVEYADAFLNLSLGYWYPGMVYRDANAAHPIIEVSAVQMSEQFRISENVRKEALLIEQRNLIPGAIGESIEEFYKSYEIVPAIQAIPILSIFFNPGSMSWIVMLTTILCIKRRNRSGICVVTALLLLFATLLVSPVVLFRYSYPLFLALPVMLALCIPFRNKQASL